MTRVLEGEALPPETILDAEGFAVGARPLCPFCSKAWSDSMIEALDLQASAGCDTCGYGGYIEGRIDITCSGCGRLIYRKEFRE